MIGGHHVLDEVARHRNETTSLVFSVQALTGLRGQHNAGVPLCQSRAANVFKAFSKRRLVLLILRKQDNVCDDVFLEQRVPIDRGRRTDAPRANAAGNHEIANLVAFITVK